VQMKQYVTHFRMWGEKAYEDYFYLLGNVLLFVPAGFFLHGPLKRKAWTSFLIVVAFCVAMEALQYVLRMGHCDVDDVILNALGTALGLAIAAILNAIAKPKKKKKEPTL